MRSISFSRRSSARYAGLGRRQASVLGFALASLTLSACAVGITHTVRPGENLYRIGKAYGISYTRLGRINRVYAPYEIRAGDLLYVPGATRQLPVTVITPRSVDPARPKPSRTVTAGRGGAFIWPASGKVSSRFGGRGRSHHDGVDIVARRGSDVRASRAGVTIFSDRLAGYGNVVIIEHGDSWTTVYAHNERNLVRKGSRVSRGQRIATVGSTGRATGPHLHFEVRKHNVARNPLYYLPKP